MLSIGKVIELSLISNNYNIFVQPFAKHVFYTIKRACLLHCSISYTGSLASWLVSFIWNKPGPAVFYTAPLITITNSATCILTKLIILMIVAKSLLFKLPKSFPLCRWILNRRDSKFSFGKICLIQNSLERCLKTT